MAISVDGGGFAQNNNMTEDQAFEEWKKWSDDYRKMGDKTGVVNEVTIVLPHAVEKDMRKKMPTWQWQWTSFEEAVGGIYKEEYDGMRAVAYDNKYQKLLEKRDGKGVEGEPKFKPPGRHDLDLLTDEINELNVKLSGLKAGLQADELTGEIQAKVDELTGEIKAKVEMADQKRKDLDENDVAIKKIEEAMKPFAYALDSYRTELKKIQLRAMWTKFFVVRSEKRTNKTTKMEYTWTNTGRGEYGCLQSTTSDEDLDAYFEYWYGRFLIIRGWREEYYKGKTEYSEKEKEWGDAWVVYGKGKIYEPVWGKVNEPELNGAEDRWRSRAITAGYVSPSTAFSAEWEKFMETDRSKENIETEIIEVYVTLRKPIKEAVQNKGDKKIDELLNQANDLINNVPANEDDDAKKKRLELIKDKKSKAKSFRKNLPPKQKRYDEYFELLNDLIDEKKETQDAKTTKAAEDNAAAVAVAVAAAAQKAQNAAASGDKAAEEEAVAKAKMDTLDSELDAAKAELDKLVTTQDKNAKKKAIKKIKLDLAEAVRVFQASLKSQEQADREIEKQLVVAEFATGLKDEALDTAATLVTLDRTRANLQKRWDDAGEFGSKAPNAALLPQEPAQTTFRSQSTKEPWPVYTVPFSQPQMNWLFQTQSEVWPEYAERGSDAQRILKKLEAMDADADPVGCEITMQGAAPSKVPEAATGTWVNSEKGIEKAAANLTAKEVQASEPMLFNKPYARRLLRDHLLSIKADHKTSMGFNGKARFVDIAGAFGDIEYGQQQFDAEGNPIVQFPYLEEAIEQLLPFFESMFRYRNTVVRSKILELTKDSIVLAQVDERRNTEVQNALKKLNNLNVREDWDIEARRLVLGENGRLPGQLATTQPHFLPLRISAPPRVGKSATGLLVASLAKRLGMVCFYSVSPNKKTPLAELEQKLNRIGWRRRSDAAKLTATKNEKACTMMDYSFHPIQNVWRRSNPDLVRQPIDMVGYSSDIDLDCQQVGAMLAAWRRSEVVVFHLRDEAQSLAKDLDNKGEPSHKIDVPPPPVLQYLRYYYGNMYGLNCNISATHFPTFLEEDLWGYIGTVGQNARAGMSVSASLQEIKSSVGRYFLPNLVPALRPAISSGYMGVSRLRTWLYVHTLPADETPDGPAAEGSTTIFDSAAKAAEFGKLNINKPTGGPEVVVREYRVLKVGANHSGNVRDCGVVRIPGDDVAADDEVEEPPVKPPPKSKKGSRKYATGDDMDDETKAEKEYRAYCEKNAADLTVEELLWSNDVDNDGDSDEDNEGKPGKQETPQEKAERKRRLLQDIERDQQSIDEHFIAYLERSGGRVDPSSESNDFLDPRYNPEFVKDLSFYDEELTDDIPRCEELLVALYAWLGGDKDEGPPPAPPDARKKTVAEEEAIARRKRLELAVAFLSEDQFLNFQEIATRIATPTIVYSKTAAGQKKQQAADTQKKEDRYWLGVPRLKTNEQFDELMNDSQKLVLKRDLLSLMNNRWKFMSRDQRIADDTDKVLPTKFEHTSNVVVPMYIGALNNNIQDTGMVTFVKRFSTIAHDLTAAAPGGWGDDDVISEYGVAFILFTSTFTNANDLVKAEINLRDGKLEEHRPSAASTTTPCEQVSGATKSKNTSAVVCVYHPADNRNTKVGAGPDIALLRKRVRDLEKTPSKESARAQEVRLAQITELRAQATRLQPVLRCFYVPEAAVAIETTYREYGISKIAILGYGMLRAGLTVQTMVEDRVVENQKTKTIKRWYCPQYLALATSGKATLDDQLQTAGRSFVELKGMKGPKYWKIHMLGTEGAVKRLNDYSGMEERLGEIGSDRQMPLYEALKDPRVFGAKFMATQEGENKLGVVGKRRGDFASILGLTATTASRRAKDAESRASGAAKSAESAESAYDADRAIFGGAMPTLDDDKGDQDEDGDKAAPPSSPSSPSLSVASRQTP